MRSGDGEGGPAFLRNRWYAAAWDHELDRQPLGRTICGEPIVLYRRLDRGVVALRDACTHRLLPLSMGIKEGDNLRCRYHGMLFGPGGDVLEMPVPSEAPAKALCARKYAAFEKHRLIWVWIGDREADPALIPDMWPCSHPDWVADGGYYHIRCNYLLLIDNLMDLTHETFVHQSSIGQRELMDARIIAETRDEEVFVTRWIPNIAPPPFWRDALKRAGRVDRWQICRFMPPGTILIDVGVAPIEAGSTIEQHDQGVRGMVLNAITPESETSTHYFWGMARNFDIGDHGFTARFRRQQAGVFAEDVDVLEAQQRSIALNQGEKLRALSIDGGGVRARLLIDRLIATDQAVAG